MLHFEFIHQNLYYNNLVQIKLAHQLRYKLLNGTKNDLIL